MLNFHCNMFFLNFFLKPNKIEQKRIKDKNIRFERLIMVEILRSVEM